MKGGKNAKEIDITTNFHRTFNVQRIIDFFKRKNSIKSNH